ncbi:MAG: hypothetical protein FJ027_05955 [Candidatus Rokubacteria bacterium]|nr:hypothetical protein [Candidatus Rokubacteria bacterium]
MRPAARAASALLAGALLFAVAACDSRAPQTSAPAPAPASDPREDAVALAAKGEHAAAVVKYREALQREPDDVGLHFGLASSLSQLDRREETIAEFQWVVANGPPGSLEVATARQWLAGATGSEPTRLDPAAVPTGTLSGKITWPGLPSEKEFGIRVMVHNGEGPNAIRKFARTKMNDSYAIADLPEGSYTVVGLAGPTRVWSDIPITITPGRPTVLDLTPANAVVSPNDFPPRIR